MALFSPRPDLEKLKAERDLEGLASALKSRDSGVRERAVAIIAELRDPAAVQPLIEMMYGFRIRQETWDAAEEAIRKLGPVAVEPLVELSHGRYATAANKLALLGEDLGREPLLALLQDDDPSVADAAYQGLLDLGMERALAAEPD